MDSAKIKQYLLQALTDAWGSDEIDQEIAYTFLIYIQLGIIKAAYPAIKAARNNVIELLDYLEQLEDGKDNMIPGNERCNFENIKLLFESNEDALVEIIEDVWNTDNSDQELQWVDIWVNNCMCFLKELDFKQAFIYITKLAFGYLKLDNESLSTKMLLNSFVQLSKSLLKSNKIIRIA